MKADQFEDIIAWQKAKTLTFEIYTAFKLCRDLSFKNQIERASISIMNNIAEGYERQTNKDFRNFLYIAKGSCAEVRSMLSVAEGLGYIPLQSQQRLSQQAIEISKILSGFIKTL
ncbi:MAG: four helix bundle protein [Candidatus Pacebacteria bacterium]|nr:four helix bundle protein [Candidatus Paceibacterota bacterium]MBP9701162.1 four helix bundle protein [Candidatus Paceibacterota bacterium]